jgi:LPXTG-site transpeptidase (sortase) family protein
MKLKSLTPTQLISIGILTLGLAIVNLFTGIPGFIRDYIEQSTINSGLSTSKPVDVALKAAFGTNITAVRTEDQKMTWKRQMLSVEKTMLNPSATVQQQVSNGYIPDRIVIDSIGLDAPVRIATYNSFELKDQWFEQWNAPDEFAAGWHDHSAPLGKSGNTVLNGHHNVFGEVFGDLVDAQEGDLIRVYSGNKSFWYEISSLKVVNERDAGIETRTANAEMIGHTSDNRLTLVTCWPKRNNTHRLIVVAFPVNYQSISSAR